MAANCSASSSQVDPDDNGQYLILSPDHADHGHTMALPVSISNKTQRPQQFSFSKASKI